MVNVKDKTCEHYGCTMHPNFNNPGDKGGRF
jgi:Rieske Fe-S protein